MISSYHIGFIIKGLIDKATENSRNLKIAAVKRLDNLAERSKLRFLVGIFLDTPGDGFIIKFPNRSKTGEKRSWPSWNLSLSL